MRKLLIALLAGMASTANAGVALAPYQVDNFNPSAGEEFTFKFNTDMAGKLGVDLYTEDGDHIRQLRPFTESKVGETAVSWDGKDSLGAIVPNEAYIPVWTFESKGKVTRTDPRKTSGGEIIQHLAKRMEQGGVVHFVLPAASRVLARTGITTGPMMRSLLDWEPRPAGMNRLTWDGMDESGIVRIADHPDLGSLVLAYRLPDKAIIVHGGNGPSYTQYRKDRGWKFDRANRRKIGQKRNGNPLSPAYFEPRYQPVSPKIDIAFKGEKVAGKTIVLDKTSSIHINIDPEQRWVLENSLFEVSFYIDHKFHSEEEQGYLPFSWVMDPNTFAPGKHLLTVNISGFDGHVGVASVEFEVK